MKTYYLLYEICNKVNGKVYVGKHTTKHLADKYFGSGVDLRRDMTIYGPENFEMKILCYLNNQEELDLLERLVVDADFCAREDTYNIHTGGANPVFSNTDNPMHGVKSPMAGRSRDDLKGVPLDADHRANIAAGLRAWYAANPAYAPWNKGMKRPRLFYDVICKKVVSMGESDWNAVVDKSQYISITNRDLKAACTGFTVSDETRRKQSAAAKGRRWWNDGSRQTLARECPGEGWIPGRCDDVNRGRTYSEATKLKMRLSQCGKPSAVKGRRWWTDGTVNRMSAERPAEGWREGITRHAKRV